MAGQRASIIAGEDNTVNGEDCSIIGSEDSTIEGTSILCTIIACDQSSILDGTVNAPQATSMIACNLGSSAGRYAAIIGCEFCTQDEWQGASLIAGSNACDIAGTEARTSNVILGSTSSDITDTDRCVIVSALNSNATAEQCLVQGQRATATLPGEFARGAIYGSTQDAHQTKDVIRLYEGSSGDLANLVMPGRFLLAGETQKSLSRRTLVWPGSRANSCWTTQAVCQLWWMAHSPLEPSPVPMAAPLP